MYIHMYMINLLCMFYRYYVKETTSKNKGQLYFEVSTMIHVSSNFVLYTGMLLKLGAFNIQADFL